MAELISSLSTFLKKYLPTADEVWIATALLNREGQKFVENIVKPSCIQHHLVGIDLPSHPEAIKSLWKQTISKPISIKIYAAKEDYHPKVYIIRIGGSFKAIVGSANCTSG